MNDVASLKNDVNLDRVVQALGGYVRSGKCECPVCHGKISIAEGHTQPVVVKCWGTCADNSAAIDWLRERGAWGGSSPTTFVPRPHPKKAIDWRHAHVRSEDCNDPLLRSYLRHRRIKGRYNSLRLLRRSDAAWLGLENANFMLAEVTNAEGLCGIQLTRLASPPTCRVKGPKLSFGSIKGGWVALGRYNENAEIIVGEGPETVCSALELLGVPYGRATLGAWNLPNQDIPRCKQVLICVDRDEDGVGEQNATALARRLKARGQAVTLAFPPGKHKDWNDYHVHVAR